jgi:hypothetical protein
VHYFFLSIVENQKGPYIRKTTLDLCFEKIILVAVGGWASKVREKSSDNQTWQQPRQENIQRQDHLQGW